MLEEYTAKACLNTIVSLERCFDMIPPLDGLEDLAVCILSAI